MSSLRQQLYWKAPYFLKKWMVYFNSRGLDRERFGPEHEQIVREILERDNWTAEQFEEYQRQQLTSLVRHAVTKVPYYRKAFSEAGITPDSIVGRENLPRLPILDKDVVRRDPLALVDETLDVRKLLIARTSGTTGTPLNIYTDVHQSSAGTAYFYVRCHRVAGMRRRRNPSVSIGGHLVAAPDRTRPPFWIDNRHWKHLYMSSYHLSPRYLDSYVSKLRSFKGDYIEGYPSSVYAVAKHIIDNKLDPVPFKACFTTAEALLGYHREAIKEAFCCRTYDQYGCVEQAVFAAECEDGSMHLSPEVGIVEVVDDSDRPVPLGQAGQIICTSLIARVQPLIRYRLGDIVSLGTGACSCGRRLPVLESIEGRTDTVFTTKDGRRIGRLSTVIKGVKGVRQCQFVQNDYDKFVIRIVPDKEYSDAEGRKAIHKLRERLGGGDISVQLVDEIERTARGKFVAVVCNLPHNGSDSK